MNNMRFLLYFVASVICCAGCFLMGVHVGRDQQDSMDEAVDNSNSTHLNSENDIS